MCCDDPYIVREWFGSQGYEKCIHCGWGQLISR